VPFAALGAELGGRFGTAGRGLGLFRWVGAFGGDDAAAGVTVGGRRDGCDVVGWRCWAGVWVCLLFLFGAGLGWMHFSF
jgi:hypothetical protein